MKIFTYIFFFIIFGCTNTSKDTNASLIRDTINADISLDNEKAFTKYPNDSTNSDSYGYPIDSLSEYHLPYDTLNNECLNPLYFFNEPILSNYYLGQKHIRFVMYPEFGFAYIIHLSFDSIAGNIRTILFKQIMGEWIKEYKDKGFKIKTIKFHSSYIFTYAFIDTTSTITAKDIETLLKKFDFKRIPEIPHRIKDPKYLGVVNLYDLEVHTNNYYHYITRRNRLYLIDKITQAIIDLAINKGHPLENNLSIYTTVE